VTYAATYDHLESIDSLDDQTVRLAYGGSARKCRTGSFEADACSWNREHLWPQSYGVGESSGLARDAPPRVDMHALVPANAALNSARGNRVFSQILNEDDTKCAAWSASRSDGRVCETPAATATATGENGSAAFGGFWQPPPSMKGFIARAMFYMDVRYDGTEPDSFDLRLAQDARKPSPGAPTPSPTATYEFGRLSDLLRWHARYPAADWELRRNAAVCGAQGNRNPFTDRPELVASVFGTADAAETGGRGGAQKSSGAERRASRLTTFVLALRLCMCTRS
jgi:endonuclease I